MNAAHRLWIHPQESRRTDNAAYGSEPVGGAELKPSGFGAAQSRNWLSLFLHSPDARVNGAVPMSSQVDVVTRARAVRVRLIAIAEACYVAGVPLPMRDELARICGATRRQIDRHISYLRDIGRITIERRANRAWVEGVVA